MMAWLFNILVQHFIVIVIGEHQHIVKSPVNPPCIEIACLMLMNVITTRTNELPQGTSCGSNWCLAFTPYIPRGQFCLYILLSYLIYLSQLTYCMIIKVKFMYARREYFLCHDMIKWEMSAIMLRLNYGLFMLISCFDFTICKQLWVVWRKLDVDVGLFGAMPTVW